MFKTSLKAYNNKKEATSMKKTFTIIIHETDEDETGYWAECLELPACFSQGETIAETKKMLKEAIELYLQDNTQKEFKKVITDTLTLEVANA